MHKINYLFLWIYKCQEINIKKYFKYKKSRQAKKKCIINSLHIKINSFFMVSETFLFQFLKRSWTVQYGSKQGRPRFCKKQR